LALISVTATAAASAKPGAYCAIGPVSGLNIPILNVLTSSTGAAVGSGVDVAAAATGASTCSSSSLLQATTSENAARVIKSRVNDLVNRIIKTNPCQQIPVDTAHLDVIAKQSNEF
jgi:hypothetical protein